ncbi:MAG: hypothetical protein LBI38_01440 [Oscillospiraceae bacterium]|nr:hypothetical protein [Oscillospiraceae bacterium]
MNRNLLGIIIIFAFVFFVLLVSSLIGKKVSGEISRKIVHIGAANCWWIAARFLDSPVWASIPPIFFIVFNFISVKFNVVKAMERKGGKKGAAGYGTVFYPVSLLIIFIFCFSGSVRMYVGSLAVVCMGYGDGFAAIVGEKFGKRKFKFLTARKSAEGCAAMFAVSFVSSAAVLSRQNVAFAFAGAFLTATVATCLETFTPDGYDNLTVPLGVGLFARAVL